MQSVAGSQKIWLGLLVAALLAAIPAEFGGVAKAGTVDIFSQPGKGSNNISGNNTAVIVSPAWAVPAGPEYAWISYSDTGCNTFVALTGFCTAGPDNPVGTSISSSPTAVFYQSFTIASFSVGNLNVWADDTAGVYLDTGVVTSGTGSSGTLEWAPNGTVGTNCAGGPIGCLAGMNATIPLALGPGTYTLVVDAYQLVGGSPFGVMFQGTFRPPDGTPEPASYMLMGLGLAALGTWVRRRKRA